MTLSTWRRPALASAPSSARIAQKFKGSDRWWDVVVSPILDEDGRVDRLMAVSRDVSEVHLAREALREADRRKDDFLAVLAHELRNPLSTAGRRIAPSMGPRFRGESFLPVAGTTS
jgi:signal transduction histidine kinase